MLRFIARGGVIGFVWPIRTYPGDNHNIADNFGLAMQRSIAFFDQYVKGTG
jgi:hypothetical protein